MEPSKFGLTQKLVENMPHFMKKGNHIIVAHQGRSFRCGLRQVGDDGSYREAALSVG